MRYNFIIIFLLFLAFSCSNYEKKHKQNPIAKVFGQFLYPSDIKDIFPPNLSANDSIVIAKNFIEKWIKKQLILKKAELNLTDEQKNVEKQLEDYRTSLLIFKYEQQLIKQKLDTIIAAEEIENYYNENSSNFILDDNIIKAIFIKIPKSSPNIDRVKIWYKSEKEDDISQLEDYCYKYAAKYDYLTDKWNIFDNFLKEIPLTISNQEQYLKIIRYIETQDSLFYYFINIKDYRLKSTVVPLSFIEGNIKSIILNKRKIKFIKELENNSYNDALNRNYFEIY